MQKFNRYRYVALVRKSLINSLSDRFIHIYYSYFIRKEPIIYIVWHWVFLIKQSFHPRLLDMRYIMANEVRKARTYPANARSRGITVDYCVFSGNATSNGFLSIDSIIIVTASFYNNICTFFILGTSLESLSVLCHEDIAILGKKKKKKSVILPL